jgi:demethylmenaquinone methyltransferase/2-methoxy-6-polyprenyl-1,4-benzoquinol methylase
VSFRTLATGGTGVSAVIADINVEMLKVGRERAAAFPFRDRIKFVEANAEALPFPDKHFDAVTIAFGIRNVPRIPVALDEIFRVLKHGGHFLCLEFSSTDMPVLEELYEAYSFKVIPEVGRMVTGDRNSYQYLVESIRKFPDRETFAGMIRKAGFSRAQATALSGGIVALHSGWRL